MSSSVSKDPSIVAPDKPQREAAWMIETGDHKYWNGKHANQIGFTHDLNDAVRFARFEDSERVIHHLMQTYSVFLASREHVWIDGVAQEPTQSAYTTFDRQRGSAVSAQRTDDDGGPKRPTGPPGHIPYG